MFGVSRTLSLPADSARLDIQSGNELPHTDAANLPPVVKRTVEPVARNDQQIIMQNRRGPGTVVVIVGQTPLPKDIAFRRNTGRAMGAEVNVDTISIDNRRGSGVGVFRMNAAKVAQAEHLDIPPQATRGSIEPQQAQ